MMGPNYLLMSYLFEKKMDKLKFKKSIPCRMCDNNMTLKTRIIFGTSKKEHYYECNTCGRFQKRRGQYVQGEM